MALTRDIAESWRNPGQVMRRLLAGGLREDRALAMLMGACGLMFLARWPMLARAAHLDPSVPMNARLGGALLGLMFLAPLVFYVIAGASRLILRVFGGRMGGFAARLALFWALLASTPAMLVQGLAEGLAGPGAVSMIVGLAGLALFLFLWAGNLRAALGSERTQDV